MTFKIGLVGLCTSHPENWVPAIRELKEELKLDLEITTAWDSGETRPAGFAKEFCGQHAISGCCDTLEEMVDQVDGVIVHTTNWDKHIEQALPFVNAGKAVLLDKPIAGNLKDINIIQDWIKQGKCVTGGSSLRYTKEVNDFLNKPVEERGNIHSVFAPIGVDDFNYGIHAYAMVSAIMGSGISSVQYVGKSLQKHIKIQWKNGNIAMLTIGQQAWLPFTASIVTDKAVEMLKIDTANLYKNFLREVLPAFIGAGKHLPYELDAFAEPELAALAARTSWMNNGQEVFLTDLRLDDPGYDGTQFALEYRRARM